ncbi:hypothetical protein ACHMW4_17635 [Mesorhizobium sp. UC22_110]|uniref:hypothetical protein n=1 Tax=unclassified Mesorhizobium TaxID=325217 RepID=UPI003671A453
MKHTDMLGRSIADPVVASYLADHELLDPTDFRKYTEIGSFGGPNSGFNLRSDPLRVYLSQYEEIRSRNLPDDEEMIVTQLSFTGPDTINNQQRAYTSILPLRLAFGDSTDIVAKKLDVLPFREEKSATLPDYSAERFVFWYAVDRLHVIAKYDGEHRLMAVYLQQADRNTLRAERRRASLDKYEIIPGNVEKIEALRARIPTPRWREAMDDGDDLFNEADIAKADALLNTFIDRVKDATGKADAAAIYAAVKHLVLGLNQINTQSGMIETLERDELGDLIDDVVRTTGFNLAEGEDVTSEWREW